jgi:hypothetical protein
MKYAEQLEQETEQARANLSNALDELRGRITPGQLIDQLTDGLKDGAPGEFARNLKEQAVRNPLPVAIMGISLAWMMLGSRKGSGDGMMHRAADRIRETATTVADRVRSTANGAVGKASEWTPGMSDSRDGRHNGANGSGDGAWMESARENLGHVAEDGHSAAATFADSAQRAASETYEGVAETGHKAAASISNSTRLAGRRTLEAGNSIVALCREQPLLTTAIGVALGALLGAVAPSTDVENRVMGDTSDQLKDNVKDIASEEYEKVENAAGFGTQESRQTDASATQVNAGGTDDKGSTGRPDSVTLVPELTAPSEPYEEPSNANRARI